MLHTVVRRRAGLPGLVTLLLVLALPAAGTPDAAALGSTPGAWSGLATELLERAAPAPAAPTTAAGFTFAAPDGPTDGSPRSVRAAVEPAHVPSDARSRPGASPSGHPGATPLSPFRTSLPPPVNLRR
jgi:hypothetical protein